ncbi:Deoxyribonuclease (DNase) II [Trichuris trichiura]|uniref:Deoxyribonuclease (DNase) II n=1 Tax=Trichuris trichiura TaxID=36087 RepID=A0A077Z0H6_TRITR|nr:Deoxyribonuclease (DNase) II [Trichuris trichiura]
MIAIHLGSVRVIKRLISQPNVPAHQPTDDEHIHTVNEAPTPVEENYEVMDSCPKGDAFDVNESTGVNSGCSDCQQRRQYKPVLFSWPHGGKRVYLTGSFYNWCLKLPMPYCTRCETNVVELMLPTGHHEYKFIVDSVWTIDHTKPKCNNFIGDENNILHFDEMTLLWALLALTFIQQHAIATNYYCINQADDTDVDWFLIYKIQPTAGLDVAPSTAFAKGYGFFYLSPKSLAGWSKSTIGINENDQMLQRTLKPYYDAVANANKDDLRNTMRIWYSPHSIALPNCPKSPNQGVIMSKDDAAMWLTHSVMSFPPTEAYAWPDGSAKDNAQMLFCLSLDQNTLKSVVEALRYEAPVVYWQNLPAAYQISPYLELVTGQSSGLWGSIKIVNFTTKGFANSDVLTMRYITKTGKNIRLFDSLIPITQKTSLMAWTKNKLKNVCSNTYKVFNIQDGMRIVEGSNMVEVDREMDDSRWAVGENAALPIWCFTLSDRTQTEPQSPGSALCSTNALLYNTFSSMAGMAKSEKC